MTLVERVHRVGNDLDLITRLQMVEMLEKHRVRVLCSTSLLEVEDHHIRVQLPDQTVERLPMDFAVICLGMRPVVGDLVPGIENDYAPGCPVMNIGDSQAARRIIDAIREGRDVIQTLEHLGRI